MINFVKKRLYWLATSCTWEVDVLFCLMASLSAAKLSLEFRVKVNQSRQTVLCHCHAEYTMKQRFVPM